VVPYPSGPDARRDLVPHLAISRQFSNHGVDVSSPSELAPQLAEWFPNIARAISEQRPRGHVPVFAFHGPESLVAVDACAWRTAACRPSILSREMARFGLSWQGNPVDLLDYEFSARAFSPTSQRSNSRHTSCKKDCCAFDTWL
jgi:hypothetical protein